jgi:hypothetical protein
MREKRNAYRLLVGKPEGKRQLGRPRLFFFLAVSGIEPGPRNYRILTFVKIKMVY